MNSSTLSSSLAALSPSNIWREGDIRVVLRAYLDGSRNEQAKSLTLAAIAADEGTWARFEPQWNSILSDCGHKPYSHMKEMMNLQGAFSGWTPERRDVLVLGLSDLITEFARKPGLHVFTCTVDLDAHRRYKKINNLPLPEKLCVRLIFERLYEWYAAFPDPILDVMELFFDRNEGFMHHVYADWNNRKFRQKWPVWGLVRAIASADMRQVPALQAADMIAWARNRLATPDPDLSPLALKPALSVTDPFRHWRD